jgi:hypothetical protein
MCRRKERRRKVEEKWGHLSISTMGSEGLLRRILSCPVNVLPLANGVSWFGLE